MGRKKKTHTEFVDQVADRPFDVIESYQGSVSKIRFRCHSCKGEWSATPSNILTGGGCPLCKNHRPRLDNAIISRDGNRLLVDVSTPAHPQGTMRILEEDFLLISGYGRISLVAEGYCNLFAEGRMQRVHRLIMSVTDSKVLIDHRDGDVANNLRSNLRKCSKSQNCMNARVAKNNTSGVTGVGWHKLKSKWVASICVNWKSIRLGDFAHKADAIAARKAAEIKYFGEYRYKATNGE